MFGTIRNLDAVIVITVGTAATVASIRTGKVTNLLIGVFILVGMWAMLRVAMATITDALVAVVDDAYDAGKDAGEHRADVLDLAMHRKESDALAKAELNRRRIEPTLSDDSAM